MTKDPKRLTYRAARGILRRNDGDLFDLADTAAEMARPESMRNWTECDVYRPNLGKAFAAMLDDKEADIEENSPIDALTSAAFAEGWIMAVRRVGAVLGYDPENFEDAVDFLGLTSADQMAAEVLDNLRAGRFWAEGRALDQELTLQEVRAINAEAAADA